MFLFSAPIFLYAKVDSAGEGEEAGQAAANVAWYFFKGSIGNKWYA